MATDPTKVAEATPVLTGELLPDIVASNTAIVPLVDTNLGHSNVSIERAKEIGSKINLRDSQAILTFGVESEKAPTQISEQMLAGVRAKDTGPVGEALGSMVREMRGMDFGSLSTAKKPGFLAKMLGGASALQKFLDKYKTVESQIQNAANVLDGHRVQMLKDIVSLDRLYEATKVALVKIDEDIAGITWKLNDVNTNDIPALKAKAEASGDMADAQDLRDLTEARDRLERRRSNMLLTRDEVIRSLPSIRIVQSNDEGLAEKIQTQLLTNVSMWKRTMAVSIASWRAMEAGKATDVATDFTNDLIKQSATQLQESNAVARKSIERGIYDVDAAVFAHEKLLATINDSIDIAAKGKADRAAAEKALEDAQERLRAGLASAAQRQAQLTA